jgi:microcin C transport system substrate-binding protein
MPGTGPYTLSDSDVEKGKSITIRRRKDYWAENNRINVGQYNIDEYKEIVVRDDNLAFEMFKKGELDYYYTVRPKTWAEELNIPSVQRGLIAKRAVFNNYPASLLYIAFNTRRKPWDDIRVRKALTLLFNRKQYIEKLFYNLFTPTNSYYPATVYENPSNPKNEYNPQEALKLLAEAGWKDRDAQGRLTKAGQPLQVEVLYGTKNYDPWLTVYQEDLRKVGITLNLRYTEPETRFKMIMQRQFELTGGAWGVGSVFPEPRPEYHSEGADRDNTNNITGFKDKRVDALSEKYEVTFDPAERTKLLRELDGVLAEQYHYMLRWYDPAQRIAYWNKYGMPQGTFTRTGDYLGSLMPGIPQLWWVDPEKSEKLNQAMRDNSVKLEIPPVEDHYWQERFGQAQKEMEAQPKQQ